MEMLLMVVAMSVFGLALCALAFAAATHDEKAQTVTQPEPLAERAPQFFVDPARPMAQQQIPIEVLLLQIQRHVQLEQAAGESFHSAPTAESLHMKTLSPLVH